MRRVENRRYRPQNALVDPKHISGVAFIDPFPIGGESPAEHEARVMKAIMPIIWSHYHQGGPRVFQVTRYTVGGPRGRHNHVAYIEFVYFLAGEERGWQCGFSVSHSANNGFRLWMEVRNALKRRR